MARNIFRTAFIGMMAVAGLILLFFILKVLLFFVIAGFIARFAMRHFAHKRMGQFQPAWAGGYQQVFSPFGAESLFGSPPQSPFKGNYGAADFRQRGAIVEITRF
jgi:hypothetical protein